MGAITADLVATATPILDPGILLPVDTPLLLKGIPVDTTMVAMEVDTSRLTDPAMTVWVTCEMSWDGGVTWPSGATAVISGSDKPSPTLRVGRSVQEDKNPNRCVRGLVQVKGGVFTGSARLTTYTPKGV